MAATRTDKELRRALEKQRDRLKKVRARHKQYRKATLLLAKRTKRAKNSVTRIRDKILRRKAGKGKKLVQWLEKYEGHTEKPAASNDSPLLARWRRWFPTLSWMKGQPWCGFQVIAGADRALGVRLPDGVVYTPNVVAWAKANQNDMFVIAPSKAKAGDFALFNFPGGADTDHIGVVKKPVKGGMVTSIDGNTSPGNSGSQANGGGTWTRVRPISGVTFVRHKKINGK